ncbi:MAG TPA: hypothetical protein VGX78_10035, partial [Pirellulales bacterium]|nr:hypothetical protein [Pirellulales bacterium]
MNSNQRPSRSRAGAEDGAAEPLDDDAYVVRLGARLEGDVAGRAGACTGAAVGETRTGPGGGG